MVEQCKCVHLRPCRLPHDFVQAPSKFSEKVDLGRSRKASLGHLVEIPRTEGDKWSFSASWITDGDGHHIVGASAGLHACRQLVTFIFLEFPALGFILEVLDDIAFGIFFLSLVQMIKIAVNGLKCSGSVGGWSTSSISIRLT